MDSWYHRHTLATLCSQTVAPAVVWPCLAHTDGSREGERKRERKREVEYKDTQYEIPWLQTSPVSLSRT